MIIFELFSWFINAFVSFSTLPTRGVNRNLILDSRVRYLKGQAQLTLKAATGITDHGAYDRKFRQTASKRVAFF